MNENFVMYNKMNNEMKIKINHEENLYNSILLRIDEMDMKNTELRKLQQNKSNNKNINLDTSISSKGDKYPLYYHPYDMSIRNNVQLHPFQQPMHQQQPTINKQPMHHQQPTINKQPMHHQQPTINQQPIRQQQQPTINQQPMHQQQTCINQQHVPINLQQIYQQFSYPYTSNNEHCGYTANLQPISASTPAYISHTVITKTITEELILLFFHYQYRFGLT